MCSADVATVPVQWNDATKSMRPRVDTVHTCRNFDKLRDWALERNLSEFKGASRVVNVNGKLEIEDYLEDKLLGRIDVATSECNAI